MRGCYHNLCGKKNGLLALRQSGQQVVQHAGCERREGVGKLKVVQIAQHHHRRARIGGQNGLDEVVDDLGLLVALGFRTARWRLEAAEQWLIAALGIEVVGDNKQLVPVEYELAGQGFAAVSKRAVRRRDPPRAER